MQWINTAPKVKTQYLQFWRNWFFCIFCYRRWCSNRWQGSFSKNCTISGIFENKKNAASTTHSSVSPSKNAGSTLHVQLANQIFDFLSHPLNWWPLTTVAIQIEVFVTLILTGFVTVLYSLLNVYTFLVTAFLLCEIGTSVSYLAIYMYLHFVLKTKKITNNGT